MDYLKSILIFVAVIVVLYLLSIYADDMCFSVAKMHETMGNQRSAVKAYESVIKDFTNNEMAAAMALQRLNPESPILKAWEEKVGRKRKKR